MHAHEQDNFDDTDFTEGYIDMEYRGHDEQRHARKAKKEMVRKELDRRMDMRRLRNMLDSYEDSDYD